jgi:vanillate monooxygenase ferredoxin subunit
MNELLELRLTQIRFAAEDTHVYTFQREDGGGLPAFEPGAHIDLHLGDGTVRQYSLCNDPAETHRYEVAILRQPTGRGGSIAWHQRACVGALYRVSAPRNLFRLVEGAPSYLLLAGGIGITPILAMVRELERRRARYTLHYCARNKARMAFREEIRQFAQHGEVVFHFDQGEHPNPLDLSGALKKPRAGEHVYCCGPQPFIDAAVAATSHWEPGFFHLERFGAVPAPAGAAESGFTVALARSGRKVFVADGISIASALRSEGVDVPTSCEQGICGMCQVNYISGSPEHHDMVLLEEEREHSLMACCARSRTPELVLDL